MNGQIRAFILTVPTQDVDLASDRLWQLGVRAIEERAAGGGAVELRTSVGQDDDAVARATAALEPSWTWRTESVSTVAAETWREFAVPNWVTDDLVIVPAWLTIDVAEHVIAVSIEPAGAFGLGDHPTSRLCAQALRRELAAPHSAASPSVLDVGCGTGVLSIVAVRSGATRVRAIDVSPDAVRATMDNAALNGVAHVIEADGTPVSSVTGEFDVVVANILAPVLVATAADLKRLTSPTGRLIVSGILADAHEHVLAALRPMVVVATTTEAPWVAITLRH